MNVQQLCNKNQFIIYDQGITYFQSYNSLIAMYYYDYEKGKHTLLLGCDWDYSKTTLKHLYIFINEYTNIKLEKYKGSYREFIDKLIIEGKIKYDAFMR